MNSHNSQASDELEVVQNFKFVRPPKTTQIEILQDANVNDDSELYKSNATHNFAALMENEERSHGSQFSSPTSSNSH